jgi:acyl transferase domain-containing protein
MTAGTSSTSGANGGKDDQIPVAIVGMSCRLSGVATSPEGLWQMLSKGLTGWSNNGSNRFQMDAFWHPQGDFNGSVRRLLIEFLARSPY